MIVDGHQNSEDSHLYVKRFRDDNIYQDYGILFIKIFIFYDTKRGVYNFTLTHAPHPSLRPIELQPTKPQPMGPQPRGP